MDIGSSVAKGGGWVQGAKGEKMGDICNTVHNKFKKKQLTTKEN